MDQALEVGVNLPNWRCDNCQVEWFASVIEEVPCWLCGNDGTFIGNQGYWPGASDVRFENREAV